MVNTSVIARLNDVIACAGLCSHDDGLLHAVVLRRGGEILDIVHDRKGTSITTVKIGALEGARDLTAFWSLQDDVRNVICVADGGRVVHFSQKETGPWTSAERRRVPNALRIAGYDLNHHGLVLSGTGEITDQPFHGIAPEVMQHHADSRQEAGRPLQTPLAAMDEGEEQPVVVGTSEGVVDIAAFFAEGNDRFVIQAQATGAITEIGYGELQPASRRIVATLPGVRRIAACYLGEDRTGRSLLASTDQGSLWLFSYGTDIPRSGRRLELSASTDIDCFGTDRNELRILLATPGEVVTAW